MKRDVFRELAERLGRSAVLASNTSALSVAAIAETAPHPARVAGLHFFNPVHRMPLVEVVRGRATDDATVATLVELVRKLGKVPVVVADSPGFLVNRILFPYLDEAVRLVIEGVPGEDVDREARAVRDADGAARTARPGRHRHRRGRGEDVRRARDATSARRPSASRRWCRDGALGKKAGRGFYEYRDGKRGRPTHWATPDEARAPGASQSTRAS